MAFYDLHVHTNSSIGENTSDEMVDMAKRLGLSGLGITRYYNGTMEEIPKRDDTDMVSVMIIKPNNVEELKKIVKKVRSKTEILMIHGGDYDINREACENSAVDILCHPELGRKDSGLDHVCAKAANENNVAMEINFREILESYKKRRINIISAIKKNIKLCKKYEAKIITTSSAVTKWGLRPGRDLAAVSYLLGLELGEAIASISTIPEEMVKINREKLANKRWEGVIVR